MTDEEFEKFVEESYENLEKMQKYLQETYDLGYFDKYDFDFESEEIRFREGDDIKVKAKIIPIGSFCSKTSTWMWAWANEAFPEHLRKKSQKLKELYEFTGYEIFANEISEIEEDMAWEIAGMALGVLNAEGAYRSPQNNTIYFYAMSNVCKVN